MASGLLNRDEHDRFSRGYDHSLEVRLAEDLSVRVASLAGLALMKIVAWNERRFERDAQDHGLIMRHYLDAGNQDRVYTEQGDCFDLLNEEFDYDKSSARILGRDISRLLVDTSRAIVERTLSPGGGHADALAMAISRNSYYGNYDGALSKIADLRNGISEK